MNVVETQARLARGSEGGTIFRQFLSLQFSAQMKIRAAAAGDAMVKIDNKSVADSLTFSLMKYG